MEENFPKNIAIVMDGNGRWAQRRGLPIAAGHKCGAETLGKVVKFCSKESNINSLTVFAFSTENWKRPKDEVEYIVNLLAEYVKKSLNDKNYENAKVRFIGNFDRLNAELVQDMKDIEQQTKDNEGLKFNIAFSYGGRLEIVDATKKIVNDVKDKKISVEEIDESTFKNYLYNSEIADIDFLIRTGGERRLSNFLLWELSYAELYFIDTLWPDFDENLLSEAIENFKQRRRTFGERRAKR
jgi:undecaprenyl diphosphate synthase